MAYPLIVLGAGASHGYLTEEQKKQRKRSLDFPLVDKICEPRYFAYLKDRIKPKSLKEFVDPLINKEILNVLIGGEDFIKQIFASLTMKKNLEEEISAIWKRAKDGNDETRQTQLIALSYYLHFLFYFLSKDSEKEEVGGNSYNELTNKISDFLFRHTEARIFVINFNYDLLMYNALKGLNEKIKTRLSHKQIHGSCSQCWISHTEHYRDRPRPPWRNLSSGLERIKNFDFSEYFEQGPELYDFIEICRDRRNGKAYIPRPALTLPFLHKQEYGYPYQDSQEIEDHLKNIDRLLIIGWSAKDDSFIQLIKENIKGRKMPSYIVDMDNMAINNIQKKFNGVFSTFGSNHEGFTNFIHTNDCDKFFER